MVQRYGPALFDMLYIEVLDTLTINCNTVDKEQSTEQISM